MMKNVMAAAMIGLFGAGTAWAADPIFGLWQTQPDKGLYYHVEMKACGTKICGEFQQKFQDGAKVESDVVGKNAVYDMVGTGNGKYEGKAWKPSNGKTYAGAGTLSGDSLKIGGCVFGGLICSKQSWTRLK